MKVKGIIIHCSDSPQGRGDSAEDIHAWHTKRGFSGIGYHYIILEDGMIEKGRPDYWDGAHAKGYNHTHLGICMIGKNSFTPEQYYSLKDLVSSKVLEYNISKENVIGHYAVSEKSCPNFDVTEWREEKINLL